MRNPKPLESRVGLAVLVAAYRLSLRDPRPATVAALVVRAWRADKAAVGLRGAEDEHPSDNRVIACLCGRKGLVAKGYLERVGQCRYRLTNKGLNVAREFLSRKINEAAPPVGEVSDAG